MWWAAGQSGLHAVMLQNVRFALDDRNIKLTPLARTVWRYLFEVWRSPKRNYSVDAYALNQRFSRKDGRHQIGGPSQITCVPC